MKSQHRKKKEKPIQYIEEYSQKIQKLLQKMSVQNKFSNRLLQSHNNNISRRQKAQNQLQKLYEVRKQEEINEVQLKNLNNELHKELEDLKNQLSKSIKEILNTKRKIKELNKRIAQLQEQNIALKVGSFNKERLKIDEIITIKDSFELKSIQKEVQKYIKGTMGGRTNSLFNFCFQCFKNNEYENFFSRLQERLMGSSGILMSKSYRKGIKSIDRGKLNKLEFSQFKEPFKIHRRVKTHAFQNI